MNKFLSINLVDKVLAPCLSRCISGRPFRGFIYYPRFPDQEDPPIQPSKLFMIELTKRFRGQPWWDRRLLCQLGLNERQYKRKRRVLVKNIPEMNAMLWKVKHLIKITPVTFPDGEPTEKDIGSTKLDTAGRLRISSRHTLDPVEVQAEANYWDDPKRLDDQTKRKDSIYKWNRGYDLD